jgi:hypothetical protein
VGLAFLECLVWSARDVEPPLPASTSHVATAPLAVDPVVPVVAESRLASTEATEVSAPRTASDSFTVSVVGAPADIAEIPIDLLFDASAAGSMRLWIGASRSVHLSSIGRRPAWVDFAWPIGVRSAQYVAAGTRDVALAWPECGLVEVQCVDGEGRPVVGGWTATMGPSVAGWPHGRSRVVPSLGSWLRVPVAVESNAVGLRLRVHAAGEEVGLELPGPTEAGTSVRDCLRLSATSHRTWLLAGLPDRSEWQVESLGLGSGVSRRTLVSTGPAIHEASIQSPGLPEDSLVVVRQVGGARIEFWGVAGAGANATCQRVELLPAVLAASGGVVDGRGRPRPGVGVRLETTPSRLVLGAAVTGRDGAFQVFGPDPARVPMGVTCSGQARKRNEPMPVGIGMRIEVGIESASCAMRCKSMHVINNNKEVDR